MKILILSPFFPYPLDSGGKTRIFNIIELLRRRHQVTLITLIQEENYLPKIKELWTNVNIYPVPYQEELDYSNKYLRRLIYILKTLNPFHYESISSKILADTLLKVLKEERFHILQIEFSQLAHFLPKDLDIPSIIVAHDLAFVTHFRRFISAFSILDKWKELKNWLNFRWKEKHYFPKYQKCILMSKDDQKKILKLLPNLNTAILPNGVDTNYFTKIEGELEDKITFLGGLSHPPNLTALRYFLKSIYPYIKREFPKFRFLILGNPGEVNPEEFIIDSQIEHLGFVEDSRPYLSNSIFIAPLLSGSGTRLKILEAMSLECPVVATPIACEGITAENYKDIIIADNPKDFAREVVNLLKNKELRREIGKNARSLVVEKYDWKIVGEKYEEILKELTSKK